MKKDSLLSEFEIPSYEEWKSSAEDLLKGAPFDKKMYTDTVEGIRLSPIYRKQDMDNLHFARYNPGEPGSVRGQRASGYLANPWDFVQEIPVGTPEEFNKILLEQLNRGQNAVVIQLDAASAEWKDPAEALPGEVGVCGISLARAKDLRATLQGVLPEGVSFHLYPGFIGMPLCLFLIDWIKRSGHDPADIRGCLHNDPLGTRAMGGDLPMPWKQCLDLLAQSGSLLKENHLKLDFIGVSGMPYHNAGASAVDELGIVLAVGIYYIREMAQRGISASEVAKGMSFTFSLGSHFFMDLAKIRAFRLLWQRVLSSCGIESGTPVHIFGRTALYNKTIRDPYVNLLRTSSEAFCGVLAGLDGITIGTLDECVRPAEPFCRRISTNTHIILSEECELRRVVDPAGGSWYLEKLTDDLAQEGWKVMQQVENAGGTEQALRDGLLQQICSHSDQKFRQRLHQRRSSLIGTNVYSNPQEESLETRKQDYQKIQAERSALVKPLSKKISEPVSNEELLSLVAEGATLSDLRSALALKKPDKNEGIVPLPSRRLAADYEELIAAAKSYEKAKGYRPQITLITLGELKKHKIRADFTRSFFESGGFEIQYPEGINKPEEAVALLEKSRAGIAIVCGTDEQYAESFTSFAQAIKDRFPEIQLLLAGHPGDHQDEFIKAGMDDFIWIRSNHFETNKNMLMKLGVELS